MHVSLSQYANKEDTTFSTACHNFAAKLWLEYEYYESLHRHGFPIVPLAPMVYPIYR